MCEEEEEARACVSMEVEARAGGRGGGGWWMVGRGEGGRVCRLVGRAGQMATLASPDDLRQPHPGRGRRPVRWPLMNKHRGSCHLGCCASY